MERETLVTKDGLEQLKRELAEMVNVRRPAIAERIKEARELGDLKENAEYHDAKNEQGFIETKIMQLEDRLRTARVIEDVDTSVAGLGTRVTVVERDTGDVVEYTITGATESDPLENRISNESPIGKALIGASPGDVVAVALPRGTMELEVRSIDA